MKYNKNIILLLSILLSFLGGACELIVIGSNIPKPKVIDIDQNSSVGAVYLFKTELDNGNIPAATNIIADANGKLLLPVAHYEMYFNINRMKRLLRNKPITGFQTDTLSNNYHKLSIEFDYTEYMNIHTQKIDGNWYIIKLKK